MNGSVAKYPNYDWCEEALSYNECLFNERVQDNAIKGYNGKPTCTSYGGNSSFAGVIVFTID